MIAILNSPNQISSGYNQMIYNVSGTNTGEPNFNFVADVYVSGFTGIQARLLYPVQPNSTLLQFDISSVIKNYVSYDFIDSFGSLIKANWRSTANYYVQFGEVYDVSGVPTLYPNEIRNPLANYKSAINTIFDFQQFHLSYLIDNYNITQGRFLNTTVIQKMALGQKKLLSFLDQNKIITNWGLELSGGGTAAGALSEPATFNIFNIDIGHILNPLSIPVDTEWFDFSLMNGDATIATYRIYIDNECSQYNTMRLHWLNQLGGFDTFNFNKATTNSIDVARSQYKSIQRLNYAHSDRLKTNFNTEIVDKINLQSNWITDDESQLIQTLVESPIIFLENADGTFVPVNVTNTSYEKKKYLNGRTMFNVSIDIEYTYNRYRQSQ